MNCDRCPHMKRIRAALAPCQHCEAGKLHGQVSSDAAPTADLMYAHRRISDHTPSSGVTALAPDAENAVRILLAKLMQLDPVELLLVQHVFHGGSYASFAAPLYDILKKLRTKEHELAGKRDGFRSLAQTWAVKIVEKLPEMEDVFRKRIEEAHG